MAKQIDLKEPYQLLQELDAIFFKMNSVDRQHTLAYLVSKYGQGKKLCE